MLTISTTVYTWRWRKVPGATPYIMVMLCIFLFVMSAVLEILTDSHRAKLVFYNVRQVGAVFLPVAWVLLVWEQQNQRRWRSAFGLVALCALPVLTLVLIGTSGWHTIMRQAVYLVSFENIELIRVVSNSWSNLNLAYLSILSCIALVFLGGDILRSRSAFRKQSFFLFLAVLLPIVVTILGILEINPIYPLQPITITFVPTVICASWALFRYGLFDFVPVASSVVIEQISDAVVVIDRKYRIAQSNPAANRLFKAAHQRFGDLISVNVRGIPMLEQLPLMQRRAMPTTLTQEVSEEGRLYDATISPFMPRGQWLGDIVILRDVTEQRSVQKHQMELVIERERTLLFKNFVMDASHELRTPITNIRSTSYLVGRYVGNLRELQPREQAIAMLNKIDERNNVSEQNVQRLTTLVEDMLNMVRLEDPTWLTKTRTDCTQWLNQIVKAQVTLLAENNIELHSQLPEIELFIKLNNDQLSLAFDHIFLNIQGRKRNSGTANITLKGEQDKVLITITDDGEFIPIEDLANMFTRFYRGDLVGTSKVYSGLGLAMTRRIVAAHGGNITVESQPGITTFVVTLPWLEMPETIKASVFL